MIMRRRCVRPRARRGFTLIELIAVFGILAFASMIAIPAFRAWYEEDDVTSATRRIEALFRVARDSAVRSGATVTVVIDSVSGLVWLDVPTAPHLDSVYAQPGSRTPPNRSVTASSVSWRGSASADHVVKGESLELPATITLEIASARARFEFAPSGAAFADTLKLRWTLGERTFTLNRWTGDVIVY
jgi:prepilin-type N-terminal cleavage/methylation domain-containing protein